MEPSVRPPLIVTLDLGTTGYYNRLVIFNILNAALNRGVIGPYRVSAKGFRFKPLSGRWPPAPASTCQHPLAPASTVIRDATLTLFPWNSVFSQIFQNFFW